MNMIICGRDCEDCLYSIINDVNKARVKVYCSQKDKEFYWGQCIPCENKKKINKEKTDND